MVLTCSAPTALDRAHSGGHTAHLSTSHIQLPRAAVEPLSSGLLGSCGLLDLHTTLPSCGGAERCMATGCHGASQLLKVDPHQQLRTHPALSPQNPMLRTRPATPGARLVKQVGRAGGGDLQDAISKLCGASVAVLGLWRGRSPPRRGSTPRLPARHALLCMHARTCMAARAPLPAHAAPALLLPLVALPRGVGAGHAHAC